MLLLFFGIDSSQTVCLVTVPFIATNAVPLAGLLLLRRAYDKLGGAARGQRTLVVVYVVTAFFRRLEFVDNITRFLQIIQHFLFSLVLRRFSRHHWRFILRNICISYNTVIVHLLVDGPPHRQFIFKIAFDVF